MPHPELPYWLAFSRVPRIGAKRTALLEAHFGSLAAAWDAPASRLRDAGLDDATLRSLAQVRGGIDPAAEVETLRAAGIQAFTWQDEGYPSRLRQIDDRPPVLFVRGALLDRDELAVAVVGTRRVSPYGRQVTEEITRDLARHGVTIVSGLARGVDAVAHQAALDAGGRTIAVLACGLDTVYPPEHRGLARSIAAHGALVSEHPLGTQPRADFFPRRNRILSGMSLGALITEAGEGSGALHTANWASEQNREVFAVPGRITSPTSSGTNALIQQGTAKLVTRAQDVLEEINVQLVEQPGRLADVLAEDPAEGVLLRLVGRDPVHVDEIVRAAAQPVSTVSGTLAMLELRGLVRQVGPMLYVRV